MRNKIGTPKAAGMMRWTSPRVSCISSGLEKSIQFLFVQVAGKGLLHFGSLWKREVIARIHARWVAGIFGPATQRTMGFKPHNSLLTVAAERVPCGEFLPARNRF